MDGWTLSTGAETFDVLRFKDIYETEQAKKVLSNHISFPIFMAIAPVTVLWGDLPLLRKNRQKTTLTNNIGGTR
ncbi:MAG TPA: hypothetical protein VFV23_04345 [Verrucomicrobiae bacterium]|nr:hypothetical protein [Verrucomicrobiae bacterium]